MLKNAHLLRCRCGFCAQHTKKYASLEALLRLASGTFLSINFTYSLKVLRFGFEI